MLCNVLMVSYTSTVLIMLVLLPVVSIIRFYVMQVIVTVLNWDGNCMFAPWQERERRRQHMVLMKAVEARKKAEVSNC